MLPKFKVFHWLGPLRSGLALLTVIIIASAPFADGTVYMHDWRLFPSVIAPTIVMMLVFTFPLDLTMVRVFLQDAEPGERARLQAVMRFEFALFVLMLLAWLPFMLKILDFSPFS
jgi:L-lactate permease